MQSLKQAWLDTSASEYERQQKLSGMYQKHLDRFDSSFREAFMQQFHDAVACKGIWSHPYSHSMPAWERLVVVIRQVVRCAVCSSLSCKASILHVYLRLSDSTATATP